MNFKLGVYRHSKGVQFDTSFVDLDLHSKSHGYEEAKASADILLQTSMK